MGAHAPSRLTLSCASTDFRRIRRVACIGNQKFQNAFLFLADQFDHPVGPLMIGMSNHIGERFVDRKRNRSGFGFIPSEHCTQLFDCSANHWEEGGIARQTPRGLKPYCGTRSGFRRMHAISLGPSNLAVAAELSPS